MNKHLKNNEKFAKSAGLAISLGAFENLVASTEKLKYESGEFEVNTGFTEQPTVKIKNQIELANFVAKQQEALAKANKKLIEKYKKAAKEGEAKMETLVGAGNVNDSIKASIDKTQRAYNNLEEHYKQNSALFNAAIDSADASLKSAYENVKPENFIDKYKALKDIANAQILQNDDLARKAKALENKRKEESVK